MRRAVDARIFQFTKVLHQSCRGHNVSHPGFLFNRKSTVVMPNPVFSSPSARFLQAISVGRISTGMAISRLWRKTDCMLDEAGVSLMLTRWEWVKRGYLPCWHADDITPLNSMQKNYG